MKKETQYVCFNCGKHLKYEELEKKLTHTTNYKLESYSHRCPDCKKYKFLIVSIVERL